MKSLSQRKRKSSETSQQHSTDTSNVVKKPEKLAVRRHQKEATGVSSRDKRSTNVTSENEKIEVPDLDQHNGQVTHCAKIKMLLFPLTDGMRLGLEEDGYNPFLELTLSRKKKIASVIKHLKTKWGCSRVAGGELMIFPFNTLPENLPSSLRWTHGSINITAGEVHLAVGSPPVFRLSYGWISGEKLDISQVPHLSRSFEAFLTPNSNRKECTPHPETQLDQSDRLGILKKELQKTIDINTAHPVADDQFHPDVAVEDLGNGINTDDCPVKTLVLWDDMTNLSIGGLLSEVSMQAKIKHSNKEPESKPRFQINRETHEAGLLSETTLQFENRYQNKLLERDAGGNGSMSSQLMSAINSGGPANKSSEQVNMGKGTLQSEFSWDDNLTNLSIGGLLSEVSLQKKINISLPELRGSKVCSQETFNAAVPETIPQAPAMLLPESHSSIFDAEDTCNAFAFKSSASRNASTSSGVHCHSNSSKPFTFKIFASSRNLSTPGEVASVSNSTDCFSTKPYRPPQTIDLFFVMIAPHFFSKEKGKSLPSEDQQHKEIPLPLPRGLHDEESSLGFSGIKWNDTLGPFDLGLPTSRQILND